MILPAKNNLTETDPLIVTPGGVVLPPEASEQGGVLATGGLTDLDTILDRLEYKPEIAFFLGKHGDKLLGWYDKMGVAVIGSSRSGKGVSMSNTLLEWTGSVFAFTTKYADATRFCPRHGNGIKGICHGMGKQVNLLDATGMVKGLEEYTTSICPFEHYLDPTSEEFIERCRLIAFCLSPRPNGFNDDYFRKDGRNLISKVMMLVGSHVYFEGNRSLQTVLRIMREGVPEIRQRMIDEGTMPFDKEGNPEYDAVDCVFLMMMGTDHWEETLAPAGAYFLQLKRGGKGDQFKGVLGELESSLAWIDSPKMKRLFAPGGMNVFDFKQQEKGVATFLVMDEGQIESNAEAVRIILRMFEGALKTPGKPKCGTPNLFWIDEAAALGRQEFLVKAAGSIAGYSGQTKLVIMAQSIAQFMSKSSYGREDFEILMSGLSTRVFLDIRDTVTAEWVQKQIGEKEVRFFTRNASRGGSTSLAETTGSSSTQGGNASISSGMNENSSATNGTGKNQAPKQAGVTPGQSNSSQTSLAKSKGLQQGKQFGWNQSETDNQSETKTAATQHNEGVQEARQVRPVLEIHELINRYSINNPDRQALVNITGIGWFEVTPVPYWTHHQFYMKFGPDPDFPFKQAPSGPDKPVATKAKPAKRRRPWLRDLLALGSSVGAYFALGIVPGLLILGGYAIVRPIFTFTKPPEGKRLTPAEVLNG